MPVKPVIAHEAVVPACTVPAVIDELPRPHHVIGGSGGRRLWTCNKGAFLHGALDRLRYPRRGTIGRSAGS